MSGARPGCRGPGGESLGVGSWSWSRDVGIGPRSRGVVSWARLLGCRGLDGVSGCRGLGGGLGVSGTRVSECQELSPGFRVSGAGRGVWGRAGVSG
jgi:hypothetical protein